MKLMPLIHCELPVMMPCSKVFDTALKVIDPLNTAALLRSKALPFSTPSHTKLPLKWAAWSFV